VAICPNGKLLAYKGGLWDVATGRKLHNVVLPAGLVVKIDFSPDGKIVLYQISESPAQDFALLFLAEAASGKKILRIGEIDVEKHGEACGFLFGAKFSPNAKLIAFSQIDRPSLHVWDVAAKKAVRRIPLRESEPVVGFFPGARGLVSWHRAGGTLRVWETATGKERRAVTVGGGVDTVLCRRGPPSHRVDGDSG
jgi:WD40 repeat protein